MPYLDQTEIGGTTYDLQDSKAQAMLAPTETTSTASAAHAKGSYFIYNGTLYEATADIAAGGTITPGTNCKTATVGGEVSDLRSAITKIDTALAVKSISGKSLLFYDGVEKIPVAFSANIDYSQDGDPSPTEPIEIVGVSAINITHTYDGGQNSYDVQLPSTYYKGELNLLNGDLIKKYSALNLTSTQDWHYASPNKFWKVGPSIGKRAVNGIAGVCNYYKVVQKSSLDNGEMWINNSSYSSSDRIVINDTRFNTLEAFTSWLASVESVTPMVIVYELATPTTSEVTPIDFTVKNGHNIITSNADLNLQYYVNLNGHINLNGNTINLSGLAENTDIATALTDALSIAKIVTVPAGNYTLSSIVNVPDNKTIILSGDYHDTNIDATVISLTSDNAGFKLGSNAHFIGGKIYTNTYNAKCFTVDCHNKPIARTSIHNTMIVGDREKTPHIYTQVGVYIECDYADGEEFTRYGYLMFCDFDIYIDMVGIGYHFHRITSPGTASGGVWMTENNIHGYIRHCNRYIWYDLASGTYANSNSTIDATLQAGSVFSGETVYPAINIFGSGITISGELWDFSAGHHKPAVYFESGSARNFVTSVGNIMDYNKEHSALTTNITLDELSRLSGYKKIPVSIYQDETFDANDYISSLSNYSYRIGDIIYIYCIFKITNAVTAGDKLFTISDDAFIATYPTRLVKQGDNTTICNVLISASSPHIVTVKSNGASSSAWILLQAQCISNRIESY